MEAEVIELEFLVERDHIRRNYLRLMKTGLGRFLTPWLTAFVISVAMIFFSTDFRAFFISAAVVSALVPASTLWMLYKAYMNASTAAFGEMWENGGVVRMRFVHGAGGFESSFRDDHAFTSWTSVSSVEEVSDAFVFIVRGREMIVPRRAFADDRYVISFRRMLEENIGRERLSLRD